MTAFAIAGIAVFFWSIVNIIDKVLVERFCKDEGIGALLILSSLFPIVLLPISYVLAGTQIDLPLIGIVILIVSGILTVSWLYFYLDSLYDEDVSTVMPLMQLTPVFAFIFAYFALGELPANIQLFAGAIIVVGAIVLSVDLNAKKIKVKLILYLAAASAIIALINTMFKYVAIGENFWVALFWQSVGIVIIGICLFVFNKPYRNRFKKFLKKNWGIGLSLNTLNETMTVIGNVLFAYAILLAPLALVQSIEAYQPVFVFFAGLVITKLAPSLFNENTTRKIIVQKIIGITLVVIGSIILTYT